MKYKAFISYKHGDDDALAKSLEKSLEKFAKPTFKRRAIEVFRDGNDLSAAADLGEKIRSGLENSEFIICMASPKYAASKWCVREAEFWRDHKSIDNFLIVLTDGEILWDESTNDFDWNVTTAIPKALSGAFKGEPFYIDFRNAGPEENLNLDNPDFKNRLVLLAATLHGKSIGDMVGEATKQHKRTMRIRNSAISIIMLFMGLSLFLTILSNRRKDASLLHFQAKAVEATDPSVALRLEEEALDIYNNADFRTSAYSLISKNAFYKILAEADSLAYTSMAVSKKDNTILLGDETGTIRRIDTEGSIIAEFQIDDGSLNTFKYSPDGTLIAVATEKGAHIMDLEGNLIRSITYSEEVNALAFSSNNNILATASDQLIQLWNLDGTLINEITTSSSANLLEFSPDNNALLAAFRSSFHTVVLYDLEGNLIKEIGNYDISNSIAFSPDGKYILTGSWGNTAKLWDLQGNLIREFNDRSNELLPDRNSSLTAVFSPDGQSVLTATWENKAKLWDLQGNLLKEFRGHTDALLNAAFLSDGKTAVTNSYDNTVRIWNFEGLTGKLETSIKAHSDRVNTITFLSEDEFITSSEDGTAKIWDPNGKKLHDFEGHQTGIITAGVLKNKDSVITGSRDGKVRFWDINGNLGKEISTKSFITDLTFSPDGTSMILTNLTEGSVVYDFDMNKSFELGSTRASIYSPDGQYGLSGAIDGAKLWDMAGNVKAEFNTPQANIEALTFSPDSKHILICSSDRKARLWDTNGKFISEFTMDEVTVSNAAFSPDAKSILICSVDSYLTYKGSGLASVGLLQSDGVLTMSFDHNSMEATAMAFSPDGTVIALGYPDGTVNLYSMSTIEEFLDTYVEPISDKQKKDYNIN